MCHCLSQSPHHNLESEGGFPISILQKTKKLRKPAIAHSQHAVMLGIKSTYSGAKSHIHFSIPQSYGQKCCFTGALF